MLEGYLWDEHDATLKKGVDRGSQRGSLKLHVEMHSEPKSETILVK